MNSDDYIIIQNEPITVPLISDSDVVAEGGANRRRYDENDGVVSSNPTKLGRRRPSITDKFCGAKADADADAGAGRRAARRRSSGVSFEVHASLVFNELNDIIDREDALEEEEEERLKNKNSNTYDENDTDDDEDSLEGIPTAAECNSSWHDSCRSEISLDSVLEDPSAPILRKVEARIVDKQVRSGNGSLFERSRSWGEMARHSWSSQLHLSSSRGVVTSRSDAVLRGGANNSSTSRPPLEVPERMINATFSAVAEETEEQARCDSRRLSANNPFLAGGNFLELMKS